jgi:membrane peptidoglycan carboxypeptidase
MTRPIRIFLIIGLVGLLGLGVGLGYSVLSRIVEAVGDSTLASAPLPDLSESPTQSTKIYDRQGNLLYEIGSTHREVISIADVPQPVKEAFLAAEDKSFYTNPGISVKSLVRAVHVDVSTDQLLQGGSTITQQLAQQLMDQKDDTIWRKLRELVISMVLTRRYSKDQILERYLNEVPVGGEMIGVGTAARTYFGVPVSQLSTAQGAYIAALINAPSTLDPYLNTKGLTERQQLVLARMHEFGFLDSQAYQQAQAEQVTFQPRRTVITYPFFSFFVRQQLERQFGVDQVNQGLEVQTTLDASLQHQAETIIQSHSQDNSQKWQAGNAALLSVNPQTGQILAYVGGQDFNQSQVDMITSKRQPGSTIKPLIYYTALANGYSPDTYVLDAVEDFGGGYRPTDYGGTASGRYVTLKTALASSLNIPALRVLRGVGIPEATKNLAKMGFPIIDDYHYTLPLALGAVEVTPYQMTQAFAVLANGGKAVTVSPFLKVTDRNGKVLLDNSQPNPGKQILDTNAVAGVDSIIADPQLKRTIYGGAYLTNYTLPDRPVAAKTGTSSGPKDTWTIGYTPSLLTTVWAGNTSGANLALKADGINVAAPIWHDYMRSLTEGTPVEAFPDYQKPVLDSQYRYIDRRPSARATSTPKPTTTPSTP